MNSRITKNALIIGGSTGIGLDTAKLPRCSAERP